MAEGILPAQSAAPMKGLTNHYAEDLAYFLEVSLKPLGLEKQEKKVFIEPKMYQVLCQHYCVHHHITSEYCNVCFYSCSTDQKTEAQRGISSEIQTSI